MRAAGRPFGAAAGGEPPGTRRDAAHGSVERNAGPRNGDVSARATRLVPTLEAVADPSARVQAPTERMAAAGSLFHRLIGPAEAATSVVFLHGLMGSSRNWLSFARRVVELRPNTNCVLLDLRNHGWCRWTGSVWGAACVRSCAGSQESTVVRPRAGQSQGFAGPHTIQACVEDVEAVVQRLCPRGMDLLVGHSLGGKVALRLLPHAPPSLWRHPLAPSAVIVDAMPGRWDQTNHDRDDESVVRVLRTLRELPPPFPSRSALKEQLLARGFPRTLVEWMATNLAPTKDGSWDWVFDRATVTALFEDHHQVDCWPVLENPPPGATIDFIRATRSSRWDDPAVQARLARVLARDAVRWHSVRAGHWVHHERPEDVLRVVLDVLR